MSDIDPEQVKITSVEQLPVAQRRRTDFFCAIVFSIYFILLAIIFIFVYDQTTLDKLTYPTDNSGGLCGYTYPNYPYVYYTSLTDPTKRLCVNKCPVAGQTSLSCKPTATLGCAANNNTQYQVIIYNSYLSHNKLGLFCLPTDPVLKQEVLAISNTAYKYNIFNVITQIETSAWVSALFGILFFLLAHFFPYKMVPWTIFFGGLFSIIFGLLIISLNQGYLIAKILLCIFLVFLGIISWYTMSSQERRDSIVVCSRLVHASALTHGPQDQYHQLNFSVENFKKLGKPLLLILTFGLVYFVFFFICVLEGLSAWSTGHLIFKPNQPFYADVGMASTVLFTLLIIQLAWGAFFIKQSFNFIIGSHSVYWYYSRDGEPEYLERVKLLFKYHWGSVLGGSILQGFFYFIDLILDVFFSNDRPDYPRKDQQNQPLTKNYDTHIGQERASDESDGHCFSDFFDLIRGEALSMIALTNQNYCQAARNSQFLSSNSRFYDFSQITNRIFKINMHIVPMFITLIIAMGQMGAAGTPYAIMAVAFLSFFIITYFVSYHAEKTEGLLISTYVDEALNDGDLKKAPRVIEITYREDTMMNQANIKISDLLCNDSSFAIK